MYIDYNARLSDKQNLTLASVGLVITSTYILDTIQAGWGGDDEVYARFQVGTAFGGTAGSSITMALQIAQDTAFASASTVVSKNVSIAKLVANNIPLVVKLPVEMMTGQTGGDTLYNPNNLPYRYVRAFYTGVGTNSYVGTGTMSCMLVMSSPVTIDRPL
jgi:hypothetical protein